MCFHEDIEEIAQCIFWCRDCGAWSSSFFTIDKKWLHKWRLPRHIKPKIKIDGEPFDCEVIETGYNCFEVVFPEGTLIKNNQIISMEFKE